MMAKVAVSRVVLKALCPPVLPLPLRLAVCPSTAPVPFWSQAYAWSVVVPRPAVALGRKRIISLLESRRAAVMLGVLKFAQVEPSSVEYCHTPLLVPVIPVTAMPTLAAPSTSWK